MAVGGAYRGVATGRADRVQCWAQSCPQLAMTTLLEVLPLWLPLASMAFTTSIPSTTFPNTTCFPSSLREDASLTLTNHKCWWLDNNAVGSCRFMACHGTRYIYHFNKAIFPTCHISLYLFTLLVILALIYSIEITHHTVAFFPAATCVCCDHVNIVPC